jgi:hypothetical protein
MLSPVYTTCGRVTAWGGVAQCWKLRFVLAPGCCLFTGGECSSCRMNVCAYKTSTKFSGTPIRMALGVGVHR